MRCSTPQALANPDRPAVARLVDARPRRVNMTTMSTAGPTGAKTILIADDYADTRDLYAESFVASGYKVITADGGREAIRTAQASLPDLILMDIRMPDISGVDAMQVLRQDPRFQNTPILAFTANARESARAEYVAAGFNAVIVKPCLPDDVLAEISKFLQAPAGTAVQGSQALSSRPSESSS